MVICHPGGGWSRRGRPADPSGPPAEPPGSAVRVPGLVVGLPLLAALIPLVSACSGGTVGKPLAGTTMVTGRPAVAASATATRTGAAGGGTEASRSPAGSTPATASSGTAASRSPSATPTPSRSAGPSPCATHSLRVQTGAIGAGAGQRFLPLVFLNAGSTPCTLRGYPGVAGLNAAGQQVTQAAREPGTAVSTITLVPGGAASTVVRAAAMPGGTSSTCPSDYAGLLVTPPGQTGSIRVSVSLPACSGLSVRPVAALSGTPM